MLRGRSLSVCLVSVDERSQSVFENWLSDERVTDNRVQGAHKTVSEIAAAHNIDNPASGKIMSKVGMEQEGIIGHMIRNAKSQYKDCAVYGILQEDYLKNNASTQTYILKLDL